MRRAFASEPLDGPGLVLLALAALGVAVAGYLHARLFHRGYAEVEVVGPLFLLNAIASMAAIVLLVFGRITLFCLGAVAICVGSIVSILISHSSSFFGFAEGGYDTTAKVILVSEIAAMLLAVAGYASARRRGPTAVPA